MNKLKPFLLSAAQSLVIAAILLFILAGLARIGLVSVPDFLSPLFGTRTDDTAYTGGGHDSSFLKDFVDDASVQELTLTPERVEDLLTSLTLAEAFCADVKVTLYAGSRSYDKRYLIAKRGTIAAAYLVESNTAVRAVIADMAAQTVTVCVLRGGRMRSARYRMGDVTWEEQIGVILTHSDFLSRADDPAYTFTLLAENGKAALSVLFDSEMDGYRQTQRYTIDLDGGVVTEAVCFEDGAKIYELRVTSLSDSLASDVQIAPEYLALFENASDVSSETP